MSHIKPLALGDSENEQVNQRLREAQSAWWNDSAFFGLLGHKPELLEAVVQLFQSAVDVEGVPLYILEMMRLKGSQINKCDYCLQQRFAVVKDAVADREVDVFSSLDRKNFNNQEFLALSLAEKMAKDPNDIGDDFFEELKAEFSESQILGLVFAVSAFSFGNKINSTLQLQSEVCAL